jgi:hypothetical protein
VHLHRYHRGPTAPPIALAGTTTTTTTTITTPLKPWLSYLRADHQVRCHGKGHARRSSFKIQPSSATRQHYQSFPGRLHHLQGLYVLGEVRATAHVWRGTKPL